MIVADLRDFHNDHLLSCLSNSENDIESAAQVLLIAAKYLRSGAYMPRMLAEHLADAFEASMVKPIDSRLSSLGRELNLTVGNSRRKGNAFDIGSECEDLLITKPSLSPAAISRLVAANYKRKQGTKISPATVLARWDEYKAALKLNSDIHVS